MSHILSLRPELVEGQFPSFHQVANAGRAFDRLRPNGVGTVHNHEVLA